MFGRKKMRQVDPALCLAELRSAIELACEDAKNCGVRSYLVEQALTDAARVVATKRAASSPL
jgi:hypothetical protein